MCLGNHEEFFLYVMKNYDDLFSNNDMLELVSISAVEGGHKEFAISLFTKYEQNLLKNLDDPDEAFLETSINFYKDYIHDFEKVVELLKKGIDHKIYFGNYLMEEAADILSINGQRDSIIKIMWDYIEKDEDVSKRLVKNYLRTIEAKDGVAKVEAEIDRILDHFKVKLAPDQSCRDQSRRTLLSEVAEDTTQQFRPDSLVSAKGIRSFRDKFMSNDYRGKQELGCDYRKAQVTSVSNILETREDDESVESSLRLFQILSQNTCKFDAKKTREEIEGFFHSHKIALKTVSDLANVESRGKDELENEDYSLNFLFDAPEENETDVGFFSLFDQENKKNPSKKKKPNNQEKVIDLLNPKYKNKIIFSDSSEEEKHKKFYENIHQGKNMIQFLVYKKTKCIALNKGTQAALDFLASNRFVFHKVYTRFLFKFYKNCLEIDEIMKLEGRFLGIIKRLYFDRMNIKKVRFELF